MYARATKKHLIMKPKRHPLIPRTTIPKGYPKSTRTVRPLRYYVAGGPDIDGDAMKKDDRSMSDPDKDSEAWMSLYGTDPNGDPLVYADPFCDPRHDVFSIAAMAGSPSFKDAVAKAVEQQQGGSVAESTTTTTTNS